LWSLVVVKRTRRPQAPGRKADHEGVTRPSLVVVAFRQDAESDLEALLPCLVSLAQTAPDAPKLLVEERPPGARTMAEAAADELGFTHVEHTDGGGLTGAANAGLEAARGLGMDAVLVGSDVELLRPDWLPRMQARADTNGRPAAVVGGRLHFANGLIEHAGFYYSLIKRRWLSRFANVPAEVPEALAPTACPVSGRLQLIRHETLATVGVLDPLFPAPFAELDYCLRVFDAGLECVYEPGAVGRSPRLPEPARREEPPAFTESRVRLDGRHTPDRLLRFIPNVI
jgi:GT2 family glycosyltransferase